MLAASGSLSGTGSREAGESGLGKPTAKAWESGELLNLDTSIGRGERRAHAPRIGDDRVELCEVLRRDDEVCAGVLRALDEC